MRLVVGLFTKSYGRRAVDKQQDERLRFRVRPASRHKLLCKVVRRRHRLSSTSVPIFRSHLNLMPLQPLAPIDRVQLACTLMFRFLFRSARLLEEDSKQIDKEDGRTSASTVSGQLWLAGETIMSKSPGEKMGAYRLLTSRRRERTINTNFFCSNPSAAR